MAEIKEGIEYLTQIWKTIKISICFEQVFNGYQPLSTVVYTLVKIYNGIGKSLIKVIIVYSLSYVMSYLCFPCCEP